MVVELATGDLLYMEDVTRMFNRKERAIRRWIATRNFPAIKVDREWRFDKAAVQAWDAARLAEALEKVAV